MPRGTFREGRKGKSREDSEDSEDSEDREKIDVYMREAREPRDVDTRERARSRSPPVRRYSTQSAFDNIYSRLFNLITLKKISKDDESIINFIYTEYRAIAEIEALSTANKVLDMFGSDDPTKHRLYLDNLVNQWLNSNNIVHFQNKNITLGPTEVEHLKKEILIILNTKLKEQIKKQKQQQQIDSIRTKFANLGRAEGVKAKYNNTYRRHKKTRRHHYKKTHRRRYRK
jgi:hypothetical protein